MKALRELIDSRAFSDLDRHFARFLEAQAGGNAPLVALAAALASHARGEGHICLDLPATAGTAFPEKTSDDVAPVLLPALKPWLKELKASPVVGAPGEFKPLVLAAHDRLYLHRYWEYEQSLAAEILKRVADSPGGPPATTLEQKLKNFFPATSADGVNWQAVAAFAAVRGKFCAISGGPGTGKTHTLVLILALLLELAPPRKLRIAVAAPTGKAAMRIQESIRKIKATLACDAELKAQLPEHAATIHRLLGYIPDSASFRYHADNRLPYDVVAVDEASMVDLALMAKLFQAVPPNAKIILLGDKDQLASVEAGAVLGDICAAAAGAGDFSKPFRDQFEQLFGQKLLPGAAAEKTSALGDCVVQLNGNFRFGNDSAIYRVSHAINTGDAEKVFAVLAEGGRDAKADLVSHPLPTRTKLKNALREKIIDGFRHFTTAAEPREALAALARFRVLCALRDGPFGVAGLNATIEDILAKAGFIQPQRPFYAHRPVMITRNDYQLKLFNGDLGVLLPDGAGGEVRAHFSGPDGTVRAFVPLRLPAHETAFAMTVHKSQGSEFDRVLFVLPDRPSAVLTRELLYTGITRARQSVELWLEEKTFRSALAQSVRRTSGLRDALAVSMPIV